jgi:3-isopropylmalate dehydrogenase
MPVCGLTAKAIKAAVGKVLDQGLRTGDIMSAGMTKVGTRAMGEAVVKALGYLGDAGG